MGTDTLERGSDSMFDMSTQDTSAMAAAIGAASNEYEVKWWWKYGTPAFIDYITGGLEVPRDRIGPTLDKLLKLNTENVQVSARVSPATDSFLVEVDMRRGPGR